MEEKIGLGEVLALCLAIVIPTIILLIPRMIVEMGQQMGWLTIVIAGMFSGVLYCFSLKLSLDYSNHTLINDLKSIFGPIIARIILLPVIIFNIDVANYVLYEGVSFVGVIMPKSPMIIFWIALSILAAYLAYNGIEVISRVSVIGMLVIVLSLFFIIALNLFYYSQNIERLQPLVIDTIHLSKISLLPCYWFMLPLIMLLVLKPYLKNNNQVIVASLTSNLLSQLLVVSLTMILIINFGADLAGKLNFPFYELSKVSVRGLEVIILVAWLVGVILKLGIYTFLSAKLIAEWFDLTNYKRLVIPMAIIVTALGIFRTSVTLTILTLKYFIVGYLVILQIPLSILLSIGYLAKKKNLI